MIEPSLNADDLADTRLACIHSITYLRKYVEGEYIAHYPVPAKRYEIAYQLDDNNYWCGIYDTHLEAIGSDDCFTMLYNISDDHRPRVWWPVFI